jgi:hypothetical protein
MDATEKTIERIKALMAKTVKNGATEAEAMAATAKVSKIMADHNLSMAEVRSHKKSLFGFHSSDALGPYKKLHEARYLIDSIAALTDTKGYRIENRPLFFGARADCEVAAYLLDTLRRAMERSFASYRRSPEYRYLRSKQKADAIRGSFLLAMALRLHRRLEELDADRKTYMAMRSGSGALVVQRKQDVEDALQRLIEEEGVQINQGASEKLRKDFSEYAAMAGDQAGQLVPIQTGISGEGAAKMIR